MGSPSASSAAGDVEAVRAAHLEMLSSVVASGEQEPRPSTPSLTHSYHHAFQGFAADLTDEEAAALSGSFVAVLFVCFFFSYFSIYYFPFHFSSHLYFLLFI